MKKLFYLFFLVCVPSFGQSKCYLDYHMKHSFQADVFCWGSNTDRFLDTLSTEAKKHLDSVFNRLGVSPKNVICQKIKLSEVGDMLKADNLNQTNYYYSVFERTFDCYDKWAFKNFRGKIKIKNNSRVILEYMIGVKRDFEMLSIYIINDKIRNTNNTREVPEFISLRP